MQNILLTVFFVILARVYQPVEFAQYLTGNSLYQLFAALSTLGLGQWFSREILQQDNSLLLMQKYFKVQLLLGIVVYLLSGLAVFLLYRTYPLSVVCLLCCSNIMVDNWIDAFKNLNVATENQKRNFSILLIDAFVRCLLAGMLLIAPVNVMWLCLVLLGVRLSTLVLFYRYGGFNSKWLADILKARITFFNIRELVLKNFYFAVIGGISVVYWRSGNIVVSKLLEPIDLAYFEIAFKVFVLFQVFPLIFSSVVFPKFVANIRDGDRSGLFSLYRNTYLLYLGFGICAYTFVYLLADTFVPLAFGKTYTYAAHYVKIMLLVILFFPTAFLQANLLVALGRERDDMVINLVTLVVYGLSILMGFQYARSLEVIVYSIVFSWILFHLIQDIYLLRAGFTDIRSMLVSNALILGWIFTLYFSERLFSKIYLSVFLGIALGAVLISGRNRIRNMFG
ncbi:MAG: hypothetical protein LCH51_03240 [Bacteroidetes bacterium]|nr:hypothetical protein [Bacteroidota bacterium]